MCVLVFVRIISLISPLTHIHTATGSTAIATTILHSNEHFTHKSLSINPKKNYVGNFRKLSKKNFSPKIEQDVEKKSRTI